MFQLSKYEFDSLRSQIVISKGKGGRRYPPYAFTEQGLAMLSSVLNSKRAIQVNVQIMRAFPKLREMLSTHEDLKKKFEVMGKKYDRQFQIVFEAIKQFLETEAKPRKQIGFTVRGKRGACGKSKRGLLKEKPRVLWLSVLSFLCAFNNGNFGKNDAIPNYGEKQTSPKNAIGYFLYYP